MLMPDSAHDVPAPRLLYVVKQLESAIRAQMDLALRSRRITVPQYTALTVLEQHDEMSAAQLARHTFVSAQAMEGVVGASRSVSSPDTGAGRATRCPSS